MKIIIYAVLFIGLVIFAIGAAIIAAAEHKARKEEEKKNKEALENERKRQEQAAAIITEANETKAEARSGNHSRDIDYMANKLHELATK